MPSSKTPSENHDRLSNLNLKAGASDRLLRVLRSLLERGEVPEGEFKLRRKEKGSGQDS